MVDFKSNFLKWREHRFDDEVDMLLSSRDKLEQKKETVSRLADFLSNPPEGIRPGFLKDRKRRKDRVEQEIIDLENDISILDASIPKDQQVREVASDVIPEEEVAASAKRAADKLAQRKKIEEKKNRKKIK